MNSFQKAISATFLSAGMMVGSDAKAAGPTMPTPVETTSSLSNFYKGAASTITCKAGDQSLQIIPLEGDPRHAFIGLRDGAPPLALEDRQAAVNACMNLGL